VYICVNCVFLWQQLDDVAYIIIKPSSVLFIQMTYCIAPVNLTGFDYLFCALHRQNLIIDRTSTYASETSTLTKRNRKQLNIFERKVYRRILGPVYDSEKENWRILTNKEIYVVVKKPTITGTIRLHRLCWLGHVQRMEENRIPKRVLYMNLERTRPRGRPRNRWQDEVREDGRMISGEEWQEKMYNRDEWKKLLTTTRTCILHMPME
jgi:hypothetical protein